MCVCMPVHVCVYINTYVLVLSIHNCTKQWYIIIFTYLIKQDRLYNIMLITIILLYYYIILYYIILYYYYIIILYYYITIILYYAYFYYYYALIFTGVKLLQIVDFSDFGVFICVDRHVLPLDKSPAEIFTGVNFCG